MAITRGKEQGFTVRINSKEALMDKNTKKLIVAIIIVAVAILCATLGVSLGVPIDVLIPIGTEIVENLSEESPQASIQPITTIHSPIPPYRMA